MSCSLFLLQQILKRRVFAVQSPQPHMALLVRQNWSSAAAAAASSVSWFPRSSLASKHQQYRQQPIALPTTMITQITVRLKHAAKMGQHLERLDDMAHETSRQEAQERRQKKKEKKAAKKNKKGGAAAEPEASASQAKFNLEASHGDDDFDHHHEDEEDEEDHPQDVLPDPKAVKERMTKLVKRFTESLKGIRGAEPTPELFDDVMVQAYGSTTPLQSVAQVVVGSPTLATATCFDPAVAKDVAAALQEKMGLNPSVEEGGVVRIPIPRVSLESRQKTAHVLGKRTESYRQKIRNVRRKSMDVVKLGVAGKLEGISKDDAFRVQKEIESVTEDAIAKLNRLSEDKHNSIMAV